MRLLLLPHLLSVPLVLGSARAMASREIIPTRGIIFDLDGTLTQAGAIDFAAMYRRIGLSRRAGTDLLAQVELMSDPLQRARAHEIIVEEELIGVKKMKLREDLYDALERVHNSSIRNVAISTRNCHYALNAFLETVYNSDRCRLRFHPTLHRDTLEGRINKPDPRVANHILEQWRADSDPSAEGSDIRCEEVWFVGDSEDDVQCGKSAGMMTCLVRTEYNIGLAARRPGLVDLEVSSLTDFVDRVLR